MGEAGWLAFFVVCWLAIVTVVMWALLNRRR
jgi:hypothetical protein